MSDAARRRRISLLPLLLGLLCFTAALTPSLVPRNWLVQGALGGIVTAAGYVVGQLVLTGWRALELPLLKGRPARIAHWFASVPVLVLLAIALARAAEWQDSIRTRVGLGPVERLHTLEMLAVAVGVFAVCFLIGWGLQYLFDLLRRRLYRVMPARTANVAGLIIAVLLVTVVTRDWIVHATIEALDNSYERAQDLFATAPPAPTDPRIPGSAASLIDWGAMGQPGRNYVTGGPDAAAISAFTGRPALDPIRVYVGRADRDEPEERAALALAELQRLGAFERKILIVASPTGTGWMDPGGMDTIEYIHDGDIATVAVQYSYLQSPLALMVETETGLDQAIATMRAVYGYWTTLPEDSRPRFYMHGISLGAWSSMYSFDIFAMIDDPIDGAVWTGPPFPSQLWRRATSMRNPGTPFVLPEVGEGTLFRFASQHQGPDREGQTWGRLRIAYLQYGSDAIVFYEPTSFWRAPEWMSEPRAPDVSPLMRFVPLVTQFQLAVDMAIALAVPPGFGHNYAARDYIAPWVSVTVPENWSDEDSARLKEWCTLPDEQLGCRN